MKKSLLALAVGALAAASIASTASATTVYDKDGTSLSVYGRVQSVFYSDKASGVTNGNDESASINTSGRLGFDLRSQLTPGIAGFAKAEFEMSNGNNIVDGSDSDSFMARLMWVGVDFGQFGQVKIGKFEEAIKYAISQTDIFDDWGCLGLNGNDDRREGVVQYQWSGYGVDAILSYAFAKNNEHLDGAYQVGENVNLDYSFSAALGYTSPDIVFGPIAARIGYLYGQFADNKTNPRNNNNTFMADYWQDTAGANFESHVNYDKYQQFAIGLSWGKLNLGPYVAAQYQQRKFDLEWNDYRVDPTANQGVYDYVLVESGSDEAKVTGYEFAVGYSFANGVLVRAGYNNQKYEIYNEEAKGATIPVYVNWNINPNFQVWAEARFDAGTDDSLNGGKNFAALTNGIYGNANENVFSAGVRYNF